MGREALARRRFVRVARRGLRTLGFETQTLRIVTNPFREFLDTASAEAALGGLAALAAAAERAAPGPIRVRLAVGAATSASELALVPAMIRAHGDLCNICVNVPADGNVFVDAALVDAAAGVVRELAETTPRGEGNLNFTVNFACPPLIP